MPPSPLQRTSPAPAASGVLVLMFPEQLLPLTPNRQLLVRSPHQIGSMPGTTTRYSRADPWPGTHAFGYNTAAATSAGAVRLQADSFGDDAMTTNAPRRAIWPGVVALLTLCLACSFDPVDDFCVSDADCDDGLFCNGVEPCDGFVCQVGTPPCGDCPNCDEALDECVNPCLEDADCDNGLFCDGAETCDGCSCQVGTPPCEDSSPPCPACDEQADVCLSAECTLDSECDDGVFCNGSESCSDTCVCTVGTSPCEQDFVCLEEVETCVNPPLCAWCDEETGICTDGCFADADCDDGLFCNGIDFCDSCLCRPGTPPCEYDCDEEHDECFRACVDDTDCFDDNLCTSDFCWNGACPQWARECSSAWWGNSCDEDAECNPLSGLCELPDGSNPCVSSCHVVGWEPLDPDTGCEGQCVEPDIDEMDGFDTRLDLRRAEMGWCMEWGALCFLVAGTCQDGTVFLLGPGWLQPAEFFEPDTGAFVGSIYASDGIDSVCCGITYWPFLIECEDAVVTEVVYGTQYEVGDSIPLPKPVPGPC